MKSRGLGDVYKRQVRCDPAIAALPISGALPVADSDRTLSMLMATYPVDVVLRTALWVTLVPRGPGA